MPEFTQITSTTTKMITASSAFTTANAALAKQPIVIMTIGSYARVFTNYNTSVSGQYPWISAMVDNGKTVTDLNGISDMHGMDITVLDKDGLLTADFPTTIFEGLPVTVKTGFSGMLQSDFLTIFTGVINGVDHVNNNTEYLFSLYDNAATLTQTVYQTGDNGLPTSQDSPKVLNGHPLDILVDILQNQIKAQFGVYFSPVLIDTARIQAYRDGPLAGMQFKFTLTSPVVASDFIASQLLVPLGGYLWVNSKGQFSVNFFYPIATPTAVGSLTDDNIVGVPSAAQAALVNSIEFRFDSDGSNYFSDVTEQYMPSVLQYGFVGSIALQSDGMRSGLQGFLVAAFTANMIFRRYGFYNLTFGNGTARGSTSSGTPVDALWTMAVYEPGDLLSITCSKIPNRKTGTIGVTNLLFEVLEVIYDLQNGTVQFTLIDASYLSAFGLSQIAPNNEAVYTSVSTPDKARYMFLCGTNGKYSNGDNGNVFA